MDLPRHNLIQQNVSLASLTSWQVGGEAEYFAMPKSVEEIQQAQKFAQEKSLPVTILGGGSNVLISDDGVPGLTICLKNFNSVSTQEKNGRLEIIADAGLAKTELLKIFLKYKIAPALFMAGLPGEVGGGVAMNAGVAEMFKPREFVEITDWVEVLNPDGSFKKYLKQDLHWDYRHCTGWQPGIITRVGLSWEITPDETILNQVREANHLRLSKQPLDMPSCGSVFVNPPGKKAAQLIDSCGLKGFQIGSAQVSLKHANFIVNLGGADAASIWSVIQHVQKVVMEKTGVQLQTEVVKFGHW